MTQSMATHLGNELTYHTATGLAETRRQLATRVDIVNWRLAYTFGLQILAHSNYSDISVFFSPPAFHFPSLILRLLNMQIFP
jgi:hypothetical protein